MASTQRLRIAVIAGLSALIAWGSTLTSPMLGLERFLSDMRVSAHDTDAVPSEDIVILAIDDRSLEDFPFSSPINRNLLSTVVDKLDKSEARVIGLDILLDRPSDPDHDAALLRAIEEARTPVVLVSDPGLERRADICAGRHFSASPIAILESFRRVATIGHGVLCNDRLDEVVRAAPPGHTAAPSFVAALFSAGGGEAHLGRARPVPFALQTNGQWPFATYSASLIEVLPTDWFAGKTVLVGSIAPYGSDWHTTPLRFAEVTHRIEPVDLMPSGKLPGVVIHAYALSGLIEDRTGPRVPGWLQLLCICLGVGIGVMLGLSRLPLRTVSAAIVGGVVLYWLVVFYLYDVGGVMAPFTGFAAGLLFSVGACFALLEREERQQRRMIHSSFAHFLAPEIVDQLARAPSTLKLEAEERDITVLFTDLAGFTAFVDAADPGHVAPTLNGYLDVIVEAVVHHGGVVDKIVGDAVHALFSTPVTDPQHREHALRCALDIQTRTETFRQELAERGIVIGETRIGVNSGQTLVGNFGSSKRFDYTAHGSTINIAARLEAANKTFGTRVCVSEASRVDEPGLAYREIGTLPVRGVKNLLRLFELTASEEIDEASLAAYAAAFSSIGDAPQSALAAFEALASTSPNDGLVRYQIAQLGKK